MAASNKQIQIKNKILKANDGHYYIHVSKKEDKFHCSNIKLSNCYKMFADPSFIYVKSLRHAGHYETLFEYFKANGFDENTIRTELSNFYCRENFESLRTVIEAEIAEIPKGKKVEKGVSLDDIVKLNEEIKGFKMPNPDDDVPVPRTPRPKTSRKDLKARLDNLEEDKVLDITGFDIAKGTGIKTVRRPLKTTKKFLSSTGELNKIIFDFNKELDIAAAALISLGFSAEVAKNALEAAQITKSIDLGSIALK